MRTRKEVKSRFKTIKKEIALLTIEVKKNEGFTIHYELNKQLAHKYEILNEYKWILNKG